MSLLSLAVDCIAYARLVAACREENGLRCFRFSLDDDDFLLLLIPVC